MNKPLAGKTAIITGASSGMGRATAATLARAGAAVVITARRRERLEELAAEIAAQGGKALAVAGDASVPEDIDRLLESALGWSAGGNKYDIAVANAGRGLAGGIIDSDASRWEEMFRINVLGAAYLMRRAAKYFVDRKSGDVVVIGSVVGRHISPFSGVYGSSKFAVNSLAEALRRAVCSSGVRVSLVMPGIVVSEFQQVAGYDEEGFGKAIAHFGKLLEPQAIADGIHWLLTLPPPCQCQRNHDPPHGPELPVMSDATGERRHPGPGLP